MYMHKYVHTYMHKSASYLLFPRSNGSKFMRMLLVKEPILSIPEIDLMDHSIGLVAQWIRAHGPGP